MQAEDDTMLEANVRRVVGVAALRRLQRVVHETREDDRNRAALAKWVIAATGTVTVSVMLLWWISPASVIATLRAIAGLVR